jgi:hypothetical protein
LKESCRWHEYYTDESVRDEFIAASLKGVVIRQHQVPVEPVRDEFIAASLKVGSQERMTKLIAAVRDEFIAASLKAEHDD